MPERYDRSIWKLLANHLRQQCEVIVLHHYKWVRSIGLFDYRSGKTGVHGAILIPVGLPKGRPHECNMAEGPQALVGKTVVIAILLFLGQPDATQRISRGIGWDHDMVTEVDRVPVG